MLLLALILYCVSGYNPGIAASITSSIDSDNVSIFLSRDADTPDLCPRKRIEIIWSCIATILAASWVSVHPNLSHPKVSKVKKTLRRVELMLWAIITPELIIFWAMRQWYGARKMEREFLEYRKEQKDAVVDPKPNTHRADEREEAPGEITILEMAPGQNRAEINVNHPSSSSARKAKLDDGFKWTRTHGFFLQMGGFVLVNGKKKCILGWKPLMRYYKAGQIDLSNITEASINDHSKADGFAKGLALLETCWFIIQCIARFSDHRLVLTELELVTAALAILSLFMYFLWWNKPFNAEIPIMITLSDRKTKSTTDYHDYEDVEEHRKAKSHSIKLKNILWIFKYPWTRLFELIFEYSKRGYDEINYGEHVEAPIFYSLDINNVLDLHKMARATFSIAALFGAIHCAGWSSKILFSSHAASFLWRISSAIITGSPLVWSLYYVFGYAEDESEHGSLSKKVYTILLTAFGILSVPTIPLYIISRIILLILAFVELRDLPPGALATIQWANFVPFIH